MAGFSQRRSARSSTWKPWRSFISFELPHSRMVWPSLSGISKTLFTLDFVAISWRKNTDLSRYWTFGMKTGMFMLPARLTIPLAPTLTLNDVDLDTYPVISAASSDQSPSSIGDPGFGDVEYLFLPSVMICAS